MPRARTAPGPLTAREAAVTTGPRVLYLQYGNPGAYPPVVHGARLLADSGCEVLVLGTMATDAALTMDTHPRVTTRLLPAPSGGWRLRLHYARFTLWALAWTLRWRPTWLYVSDPLACPAADAVQRVSGVATIYHEHDSPGDGPASSFARAVRAARRRIADRAAACVLPNEERARAFTRATGRTDVLCVWNCPLVGETTATRPAGGSGMRVVYHGSVVPARVPLSVVDALVGLPDTVTLTVIGYETIGHPGYLGAIAAHARQRGVGQRVTIASAMPRTELMRQVSRFDVGLALLPLATNDVNESTMVGASNKPFDYMAGGLALVVSDLPEWRDAFVAPGYALACDPSSPDSIAAALRWLADHEPARREMGERGRAQIAAYWNYEAAFAPVRRLIHGAPA